MAISLGVYPIFRHTQIRSRMIYGRLRRKSGLCHALGLQDCHSCSRGCKSKLLGIRNRFQVGLDMRDQIIRLIPYDSMMNFDEPIWRFRDNNRDSNHWLPWVPSSPTKTSSKALCCAIPCPKEKDTFLLNWLSILNKEVYNDYIMIIM